ncbi:MAG: hypothetical protein ACC682_13015, partial [Gemmatimonadota bacterium]
MKRTFLVFAMFVIPISAHAQTASETIERALAAAPGRSREATAVIKWNADYTYETLREGTNRLVCYDRSGENGRPAFAVQCTSIANLDRIAQNRRFAAAGADRAAVRTMVEAAEADGTRVSMEYWSVWIAMNGEDQESARTHRTIGVP